MHGVARVMVKGYAKQRDRELRKLRPRTRTEGDTGWLRALQVDMAQLGMGKYIHTGPSKDGPLVH